MTIFRNLAMIVLLGCRGDGSFDGRAALLTAPVTDSVVTPSDDGGSAPRLRLVKEYSGASTGFGRVTAAAATRGGVLYLFDASPRGGESGLFRLAPGASHPEPLLARGTGPGEIATRRAVLVPLADGGVLVADSERYQVLFLDTLGAVVSDLRGHEFRSSGYWPGRNGGVWLLRVTQQLGQRIDTLVHLSRDGQIRWESPTPSWTTAPFVGQPEFMPRLSVAVDTAGRFAAAWTDEARVVYAHDSVVTAWTATCTKVPLDRDQHHLIEHILQWEMSQSVGPMPSAAIPPLKPCLSDLLGFDATGTLWVLMYGRSRVLAEAPEKFTRLLPPELSNYVWEEVERIGRFGADGRFLGWVDLAEGDHFLEGLGDRMWVVNEESDAGSAVREYVIE